jgi:thioesterase domain-containing protein
MSVDVADVLVPLTADGDEPPLYCLHPASGSAYSYLPLASLLDHRPVIGIEAPGYDTDGLPPADLADIAELYVHAIDADRQGRPVCLLGWSMGGVVAVEVAQRLRALGCPVLLTVLVDSRVPDEEPLPDERTMLARFVADFTADAIGDVRARMREILESWPEDVPADAAWGPLRDRGWLPDDVDTETAARRFAVYRRNVLALHRHRVAPGGRGPILAVKAQDSPPETRQWSELATDVRTAAVPGDHYTLWHGTGLVALGRIVGDALRQVSPARSRPEADDPAA